MPVSKRLVATHRDTSIAVPILSTVEQNGTPEDVSATHTNAQGIKEVHKIGVMRASSIYSACPRMHVLGTLYKRKQTHWISISERDTYLLGNALHYWLQNTDEVFGDNRHGRWKCRACGKKSGFGLPRQKPCPHCGARPEAFVYHEHSLKTLDPYPSTGHPDLFRRHRKSGLRRAWELKSIAADAFKALKEPQTAHYWQIQHYMWAADKDPRLPDDIDPLVGYVFYFSKGMIFKRMPRKTFIVLRDARVVQAIERKLESYHEGVNGGKLPTVKQVCIGTSWEHTDARNCPCLDLCQKGA